MHKTTSPMAEARAKYPMSGTTDKNPMAMAVAMAFQPFEGKVKGVSARKLKMASKSKTEKMNGIECKITTHTLSLPLMHGRYVPS